MGSTDRLILCGLILAILQISIFQLWPSSALAQSEPQSSLIYPPDSSPYGLTYGEWTAEWWKWFISIPTETNPINDPSGERCAEQQEGSVWFLVGSGGGKAERSCTIPAGKAIFLPAITVECSYAEDQSLQTEDDLRKCAKDDQDKVQRVFATINGEELPSDQVYRVQSPIFNVTFGSDNVFSAPEGPSMSASDGFWVFLKPLPLGNHEIHVGGLLVDYTETGPFNFIEDSTYHLTVLPGQELAVFENDVILGGQLVRFPINSSATISDVAFDENAKRLSLELTGTIGTEGVTIVPISRLLVGPYTVTIDGNEVTDYELIENNSTGESWLKMNHVETTQVITIVGTSVVPEFPVLLLIVLVSVLGAIVGLNRFGFSGDRRKARYIG
jgi:hypothetical protein